MGPRRRLYDNSRHDNSRHDFFPTIRDKTIRDTTVRDTTIRDKKKIDNSRQTIRDMLFFRQFATQPVT
jgi:hypothetical protein